MKNIVKSKSHQETLILRFFQTVFLIYLEGRKIQISIELQLLNLKRNLISTSKEMSHCFQDCFYEPLKGRHQQTLKISVVH